MTFLTERVDLNAGLKTKQEYTKLERKFFIKDTEALNPE